jgi:hypothetical protein
VGALASALEMLLEEGNREASPVASPHQGRGRPACITLKGRGRPKKSKAGKGKEEELFSDKSGDSDSGGEVNGGNDLLETFDGDDVEEVDLWGDFADLDMPEEAEVPFHSFCEGYDGQAIGRKGDPLPC